MVERGRDRVRTGRSGDEAKRATGGCAVEAELKRRIDERMDEQTDGWADRERDDAHTIIWGTCDRREQKVLCYPP